MVPRYLSIVTEAKNNQMTVHSWTRFDELIHTWNKPELFYKAYFVLLNDHDFFLYILFSSL